jgi:hypothetical protein
MKHFVKILLLALVGAGTWVATAEQGNAMLLNQNDKIWDAISQQGNLVLKGKYKESPENGRVEQDLEVEFQHIAAGTVVAVTIDGQFVRNMTANSMGVARLTVHKVVAPGPDGRPTGPRVNDGSILTVTWGAGQTMSATFIPRP